MAQKDLQNQGDQDNQKNRNGGETRDSAVLKVQPVNAASEATTGQGASADPVVLKRRIYPRDSFVRTTMVETPILSNRLFVPQEVSDAIFEETLRQGRGDSEPTRKPLFRQDQADASGDASDEPSAHPASKQGTPVRRKRHRFKPGTETGTLEDILEGYPERRRWRVIRREAYMALQNGQVTTDGDVKDRNRAVFRKLDPMGEYRRVGLLPQPKALDRLCQSHPHFREVIDFVADRLSLARISRKPVRIPPMLLAGPPGVGKTHFCNALAEILGVPCRRHQMDQAETSSALLGSEKTWSNTRVGLVFEEVVMSEYANPVIILDELDKASGRSSNHSNPSAVLHTLLEPVTATKVRDLSVDVEFDASLITWIATCNYPWQVAPTLISRMKCFWISMPSAQEALLMARSVAQQAVKDANVPGFQVPGREILVEIAHYSARQVYQIVSEAVARCVKDRRKAIALADITQWVVREGGESTPRIVLH